MNLNSLIFPAPNKRKNFNLKYYKNHLIFVPKKDKDNKVIHIPCYFEEPRTIEGCNKYILYFHGNAEDIFSSDYIIDILVNNLQYNVIAVEYPGYSIYHQDKCAKEIEKDCLTVYDYLVNEIGIKQENIVVCGRSIGSGPAVYLAANRSPSSLILISPFKSIKEVVASMIGVFNFIVADRFNNYKRINRVICPTLMIHGQKDSLISFTHSIDLCKRISGPYELVLPEEMDHNTFNKYDDIILPITSFLSRYNLNISSTSKNIKIEGNLFKIPDYLLKLEEK